MMLRPGRLYKGKKVALIAPAFHFDPSLLEQGRAFLESRFGVKSLVNQNVHEREAYFAGSDARRAEELIHWLTNDEVDAVIAIRGGYGCARIYPKVLDHLKSLKNVKPKILAGYSDLTILLNGLRQDLGWVTFHSPAVAGRAFRSPLPIEEQTFERALFSIEPLGTISDEKAKTLVPGQARGPIVGGCLSLLTSSIGTSYEIQTDNTVLFIEDVDERPYRIDRMLTQLQHAGKFDHVRAVIFGQLAHCDPPPPEKDPSQTTAIDAIRMTVGDALSRRGVPVIYDFPAGHGMPQITFPLGVEVEVRANEQRAEVEFLEAGVR